MIYVECLEIISAMDYWEVMSIFDFLDDIHSEATSGINVLEIYANSPSI